MKASKNTKQANRKNRKEKKNPIWIFLLIFAVLISYMILDARLPAQAADGLNIAVKAVISAVLLAVLVFRWLPEGMPVCGALSVLAAVLLLWVFLLPDKAAMLAAVLLIAAGSVLAVIAQCRRTGFGNVYEITVSLLLLTVFSFRDDLVFRDAPQELHYWLPGLIAGLICGTSLAVLMGRGILHLEDERTSECVSLVILAAAAAFVIVQYSAVGLNRALDTSVPEEYAVQITNKRTSHSRNSTNYYLTADSPDGELEFSVSRREYRAAEEGDTVTVSLCAGAFGDAYYILTVEDAPADTQGTP